MKLDRYTAGFPKFRVYRIDGGHKPGEPLQPSGEAVPVDPPMIADEHGNAYVEVNPWECFVLKRRDLYVTMALFGYMRAAWIQGDTETTEQVGQLLRDWHGQTLRQEDAKVPD